MPTPIRPPPKVLLIHDGTDVEAHFQHLSDAGLTVAKAHGDDAVAAAIKLQPDIIVLDFDHRDPSAKRHNVIVLAMHKPWSRVLLEIVKCDVRCANCHRKRTAQQFGWRKARGWLDEDRRLLAAELAS